ncbi:flagellar basal body rod C-terminal domain-containing protein [Desulfocurvus sp. DL9XJH121]
MIQTMDTALSALNAFSVSQAVTANNIANAATNEFDPSRVTYEDRPDMGGVAVSEVREMDVQAPLVQTIVPGDPSVQYVEASGTDIATEMVTMMVNERAYEANAEVVRTQDEMLGTLLDELV